PGPEPWTPSQSSKVAPFTGNQTEGLKPANCVLEAGNWAGIEVPSYSDENGCWGSSKNCWNQSASCYAQEASTGPDGCKIWEQKCNALDDACNAGNFVGPPNKGVDLTPMPGKAYLPLPVSVGNGTYTTSAHSETPAATAGSITTTS